MVASVDPTTLMFARAAAGLYGLQLSRDSMLGQIKSAGIAPGAAAAWVELQSQAQFKALPADAVADLVVGHLGLAGSVAGAARAYLQAKLAASLTPGQVVVDALALLATLTGDAQFGPAATDFNARLQTALDRLDQPGGLDGSFAGTLSVRAPEGVTSLSLPAVSGVHKLVLVGPAGNAQAVAPLQVQAAALPDLQRVEWRYGGSDLQIAQLRASRLTEDTVIRISSSAADAGLKVWFDALRDQGRNETSVVLELMDTRSATSSDPALAALPLKHLPFNGFSFKVNDKSIVLKDLAGADPTDTRSFNGAQTYAQLLAAVQTLLTRPDNLALHPELKLITAAFGPDFVPHDAITGRSATGRSVTLVGPNDPTVRLATGNFIAEDGTDGSHYTVQRAIRASDKDLVTGRLELDDVGRGSAGGDLLIGALPGGNVSDAAGIERLRVTVEGESRLSEVLTTGDALREVLVQGTPGGGGLQVLGDDKVLGYRPGPDAARDFGFRDLALVDMSAMATNVAFDLLLSPAAVTAMAAKGLSQGSWVYRGGRGDDDLAALVAPSLVVSVDQPSGLEVSFEGGAGHDRLTVMIGTLTGASAQVDQPGIRVRIDGGAGDDWIELGTGPGSQTVVFGTHFGNDHVRNFQTASDKLDLSPLGGWAGYNPMAMPVHGADPPPRSINLAPGFITGGPEGLTNDSAAEVAGLFVSAGNAGQLVAQVYIAVDARNVGKVYRIEDPATGPGSVSASLMGTIDLGDTPWSSLTAYNFLPG
jgi:hypothetical protein